MYLIQRLASETVAATLDGRNLNDGLAAVWQQQEKLSPQQRGAIQDLSYGTLRHLGELDGILNLLLNRPLAEPELHALLLTSLYQLKYSRVAPYAVVDYAVKVASRLGSGRGKGLTNAVLRNYLRDSEKLVGEARKTLLGRYSHPEWWISAMQQAYPEHWEAILRANNQHPPMTLRVNQRLCTLTDYLTLLAAAGIAGEAVGTYAIRLQRPVGVDKLPHFTEGWVSVQDLGAQWAATLLDVRDGQRVLDACAAPGGKTGHLLELADCRLTALDLDASRLGRVADNLNRLQLSAEIIDGDASQPDDWWDGKLYDRILADVPCSASGVVRRHPDIKWLRRPTDFAGFARQQAAMLSALWGCLAQGGKLLYATCSVFPQENRDQIAAFLASHPDALPLPLPDSLPEDGQLLPTAQHDGFYYALLEKR